MCGPTEGEVCSALTGTFLVPKSQLCPQVAPQSCSSFRIIIFYLHCIWQRAAMIQSKGSRVVWPCARTCNQHSSQRTIIGSVIMYFWPVLFACEARHSVCKWYMP